MRLRGYSLMTNVLEDHMADLELISLVCIDGLSMAFNTDETIGTWLHVYLAFIEPQQSTGFESTCSCRGLCRPRKRSSQISSPIGMLP